MKYKILQMLRQGHGVIDSQGAGGRNRTDTRLPSRDFESEAVASLTTLAPRKSIPYALTLPPMSSTFAQQLHHQCTTDVVETRTRLHDLAGSG